MELVERYLQAVRTFIPAKNADDIVRELRENILAQMDEKEESAGRPLTDLEQEAVIRQHGHPIAVAARYGPQRSLIGPTLFPFYWLALKVALLIGFTVHAVVILLTVLISGGTAIHFGSLLPDLFTVFTVVTLVFVALETILSQNKITARSQWMPRNLPALRKSNRVIPRFDSAVGLVAGTAAAVWWQILPSAPFLLLGPAALVLQPAPVWSVFHLPVLAMIVGRALLCAVDLLLPHVTRTREWLEVAFTSASLVLTGWLLSAGPWLVPLPGAGNGAAFEHVARIVNQTLSYVLMVLLVITTYRLVRKLYQIFHDSTSTPEELAGVTA